MATLPSTFRIVKVTRPVRFDIAIDPSANDPVAQSLTEQGSPMSFFRRWFRSQPSPLPHVDLLLQLVRPGDNLLDLGAHLGTFSLAAAAAGCNVLAVEASPANVALLEESVRRNRFERMHVVHAAVSALSGTIDFCPFGPFGHVATHATQLPHVPVRAVRIDALLDEVGWRKVALVKMDIEGSELAAICGMEKLLSQADAPPILFESNAYALSFYGATPPQLLAELERFGYRIYLADCDRRTPVSAGDIQPELVLDYLAIKGTPVSLIGWHAETPITRQEMADRIARAQASSEYPQQEHIRKELERRPDWKVCGAAAIGATSVSLRSTYQLNS